MIPSRKRSSGKIPLLSHLASIILLIAVIEGFLVINSIPLIEGLDFVRWVAVISDEMEMKEGEMKEFRFGPWAVCSYTIQNTRQCIDINGNTQNYELGIQDPKTGEGVIIDSDWVKGFIAHVLLFILTIPSFILSLRPHWQNQALIFTIISSLLSLTTIIVDVGLFLDLRYQFGRTPGLKSGGKMVYGPAGYMSASISFCVILAAVLIYLSRGLGARGNGNGKGENGGFEGSEG